MRLKNMTLAAPVAALAQLVHAQQCDEPVRSEGCPKNAVADKLPVMEVNLPPGFKVEVCTAKVFGARSMHEGESRRGRNWRGGQLLPEIAHRREDDWGLALMHEALAGLSPQDLENLSNFVVQERTAH